MRNEERGIWKKAISVLAIIFAIIYLCQTVSAFIYCPIDVVVNVTPEEVYLDDEVSLSVKVTSKDSAFEWFEIAIVIIPEESRKEGYPLFLPVSDEIKAGEEFKGTFSASIIYSHYGVSGDYVIPVSADVIDGKAGACSGTQGRHEFHLYNYSRPSTQPTPTVMTTPTPTSIVTPTLKPSVTATPSPTPIITPLSSPTPTPPGFEGIFAIAGLLAVTYLLRRR